jgi:hypothetical protein
LKYKKAANAPQFHEIEAINKIRFAKIHRNYEEAMRVLIKRLKSGAKNG